MWERLTCRTHTALRLASTTDRMDTVEFEMSLMPHSSVWYTIELISAFTAVADAKSSRLTPDIVSENMS